MPTTVSVLGPNKIYIKKKNTLVNIVFTAEKEKIHKVKLQPFLLNKRKIHHIQNSRGRLVLKLTTEQPRKACFKTNYKTAEAGLLQS